MNVLSEEKKQQVIVMGRLGWSLRRIQQATRIRRETARYLKAAGIAMRPPGGWGRRAPAAALTAAPVCLRNPDNKAKEQTKAPPQQGNVV